jgi:ribonucleotide monophosphatase NagD (HAD superfamily)
LTYLTGRFDSLCLQSIDFSTIPISAIFVFHDPRNWALDIQIATDVILSGGVIGAPYINPCSRSAEEKPVQLIFCNPDLLWKAEFERPRLGQGAFRLAFQAVFKVSTMLVRYVVHWHELIL